MQLLWRRKEAQQRSCHCQWQQGFSKQATVDDQSLMNLPGWKDDC
jgi:hypothetical protein